MLSLNFDAVRDFCALGDNTLATSIAFAVTGTAYATPPAVTFSGGAGTGAAGTAVLENGHVVSVTMTAAGTGYTSAPTVAFAGGGTAAGTAVLTATTVTSVTMTNNGGQLITFTDNTVYPAGDSRAVINFSLFDHFGGKIETQMDDSPATLAVNMTGLNPVDGIDINATLVSALGKRKDGSVYDVAMLKTSGNFVMER